MSPRHQAISMASGARSPGGNVLILNDKLMRSGAVAGELSKDMINELNLIKLAMGV